MLHFSVINSNGVIREYNWVFMNLYLLKTVNKANDRLEQAIILTIISILTIVTVTIVVSPILSKTEERKFSALTFFIKLPLEKINNVVDFRLPAENATVLETSVFLENRGEHMEDSLPKESKNGANNDKRRIIITMADQGYNVTEIAKTTGMGKGEIMLFLQLNRK